MSATTLDTLTGSGAGSLSSALEFDHIIYLSADLTLTRGAANHQFHAPDAHDPDSRSTQLDGWELITAGLTGQHGYNGPWLHDSETIEGGVARHVIEHAQEHGGGYYVAIYAQYSCEECGGAGQMWNADETEEVPCSLIAAGTCEPGSTTVEGWAIAYRPTTTEAEISA